MEGTTFQFQSEDGSVSVMGPLLRTDDVEKLLIAKLDQILLPTLNLLIARVEEMATKIACLEEGLNEVASTIRTVQLDADSSIIALQEKLLEAISGATGSGRPSSVSAETGQSAQQNQGLVSSEPFVSVKVLGKEYPYYLRKSVWTKISGCSIPRTIAKAVLESLHSIVELRQFTLTGKHRSDGSLQVLQDQTNVAFKKLPSESFEIAKAVVMKVMDADLRRKYDDVTRHDGFNAYVDQVDRLMKETKNSIRFILQSYRSDYEENGVKKLKPRKRVARASHEENDENDLGMQSD